MTDPNHPLTIGVFDSGFGGLTVLRALLPLLPGARFLYLGDTARLPYGSKSRETVVRYALSSCRFLHQQGADLLVVACNTATALALDDLRSGLPIPVLGVIEPGAHAAARSASATSPHVLVLATAATVGSGAYTHALHALGLRVTEKACPLLVALVEEGWLPLPNAPATTDTSAQTSTQTSTQTHAQTAVTADVLRIYLAEAQTLAPSARTLLLGCTHYPLLEPLIRQALLDLRYPLTVIDSAGATAHATHHLVQQIFPHRPLAAETSTTFFATDSIEKFARLGSRFLGQPLPEVHLIDLGG